MKWLRSVVPMGGAAVAAAGTGCASAVAGWLVWGDPGMKHCSFGLFIEKPLT